MVILTYKTDTTFLHYNNNAIVKNKTNLHQLRINSNTQLVTALRNRIQYKY